MIACSSVLSYNQGNMKRDEAKKKAEFLTAKQKFQREHRAQGICLDCHNTPQVGNTRCDSCMGKRRQSDRKRRERATTQGLCVHCCKRAILTNHRLCEECLLKDMSVRHFGTSKCWKDLQAIWGMQNGLCALSGLPMSLGENAELDHIIPIGRRGCKEVRNVQWLLYAVNRMKRDMLEIEFLALVKQIYAHSILKGKRDG